MDAPVDCDSIAPVSHAAATDAELLTGAAIGAAIGAATGAFTEEDAINLNELSPLD